PLVGRRAIHMGNAQDARSGRREYGVERHSLLGKRYRRLHPYAGIYGRIVRWWFQFAAFCPLFRSHGRVWTLHLPWGWNMGDPPPLVRQETPSYQPDPNELHNAAIE